MKSKNDFLLIKRTYKKDGSLYKRELREIR
jgi:hypothetical protein